MATDQAIVIDTPEGITAFRYVTMKHALDFEIRTGMKMTRISALKALNETFGTSFKRKQQALDFITGVVDYMNGDAESLPEVPGMEWAI